MQSADQTEEVEPGERNQDIEDVGSSEHYKTVRVFGGQTQRVLGDGIYQQHQSILVPQEPDHQ